MPDQEGIPLDVLTTQIAIGQKPGIITIDKEKPDKIFEKLLFVELEYGLVSQLYKLVLEMIANDDNEPLNIGVSTS